MGERETNHACVDPTYRDLKMSNLLINTQGVLKIGNIKVVMLSHLMIHVIS